jgi:hypothetical protein
LSDLIVVNGYPSQYFEKGRLEDHRRDVTNPAWAFMFGRLTAELMERDPGGSVSGTSATYRDLSAAHRAEARIPPPSGFTGGTMTISQGEFIPYDSQLRPAPGYVVPLYFWTYMQRADLFPSGWLHAIGLPMTGAFQVEAIKGTERRPVIIQAFERTVLTYDPRNPPTWQVERANIGADALRTIQPPPPQGPIQIPSAGARVTLPLHVLARVGHPGQQVVALLRWQDGTTLTHIFTLLRGEDGNGLLIGSIDWVTESQPPQPGTQPATLEIRDATGNLMATQQVTVLSADDPNTQRVSVFFVLGETVQSVQRQVPATPAIGTAALEELLWGPGPRNFAGFTTAIPTPEEVLRYPGREPDWGPRVTLLGLTIENGVATANFSQEMRAYGGGSLRVQLIRQQITRTLQQFPTVREVRIAIEGQTEGVLEP